MTRVSDSLRNLAEECEIDAQERARELRERAKRIPVRERVRVLKALAEPTRLRILHLLGDGEMCVCELMAALDAEQSTVSRHLRILRDANLIIGHRDGKWVFYRLRDPEILSLLDELL